MNTMTIRQLATAVGMNPPTIRYYEEIGLIPPAHRSESGYRLYSGADVRRLELIRRAKMLSLSLEEIRLVVGHAAGGRCDVLQSELLALLRQKQREAEERIRDLGVFQEELGRLCEELEMRRTSDRQPVVPSAGMCDCLGTNGK